jgi:hypothetical protein
MVSKSASDIEKLWYGKRQPEGVVGQPPSRRLLSNPLDEATLERHNDCAPRTDDSAFTAGFASVASDEWRTWVT